MTSYDRMISVHFQGKPFNIAVIQVHAPANNAEEAEVEWVYEDLQDLLELTPKKDVLFIIGDWDVKIGSQEPGVSFTKANLALEYKIKQGKGKHSFIKRTFWSWQTLFQQLKR